MRRQRIYGWPIASSNLRAKTLGQKSAQNLQSLKECLARVLGFRLSLEWIESRVYGLKPNNQPSLPKGFGLLRQHRKAASRMRSSRRTLLSDTLHHSERDYHNVFTFPVFFRSFWRWEMCVCGMWYFDDDGILSVYVCRTWSQFIWSRPFLGVRSVLLSPFSPFKQTVFRCE